MFIFFFIIQIAIIYAEITCDNYFVWNHKLENVSIFTVSDYYIPPSMRIKKNQESISCSCYEFSCLRKCCLLDDTFTIGKQCQIDDFLGESKLMEMKNLMQINNNSNFTIIYGSYCNSIIKPLNEFNITKDGIMTLEGSFLPLEDYCLEYFSDIGEYRILQCLPNYTILPIPKIYTIGLACSIFFLFATFVIYCCIQNLRNLPGKILLCYIGSLLVTNIFYMLLQLLLITDGIFCLISAHIIHFSFLSCFFWLNVMCFDLWWIFREYRPFNCLSKERNRKKFVIYCFYAWGCPAIITVATLIVNNTDLPYEYKPKIGVESCWFGDDFALFCYFYSFISVILFINFIMFVDTTIVIIRHNNNEAKLLKGEDSKRHRENEKKRFYVYLKLFSIMGINWLMELLSYYHQQNSIIWNIMDLFNILQGTMIFIIFVCKRKVIILLNKKVYPNKMLIKESSRTSSGNSIVDRGNKSITKIEMEYVNRSDEQI